MESAVKMPNADVMATSEHSLAGSSDRPQSSLLCDMELPHRGVFYPLGYPVEIVTNDTAVLEAARESFGHSQLARAGAVLQVHVGVSNDTASACPLEPTRREFNHLYSLVADGNNQALLDLMTQENFTWVTSAAVRNRMYFRSNFLEKVVYLLLGSAVVTDIHAACVSRNGKGFLLVGDSGAGKSTLAYGCARAGWVYTSDDTSYLINDSDPPRVVGHSHRARFRPAAKELFPELKRFELTPRIEGKPSIEVSVSELQITQAAPEATVDCIVYLKRNPAATGELTRLRNGVATERFRKELYSAGDIRAKHERHLELLYHTPTYELDYSDLSQGIVSLEYLSRVC
jgi:hypothetical protein